LKRIPILILCLGGQGASVLSRTFNVCGMSFGNEKTYWQPEFLFPHGEHSYVTMIMAWIYQRPKEEWQPMLRDVLRSYRREAEVNDWKCYGIKTSSGICNPKWEMGVGKILQEEWPDSLYFGVIRKPYTENPTAYEGWKGVWAGRKGMVDRGGIFIPFPDAWLDGSIKRIVELIGLDWNDKANEIFNEPFEEKKYSVSLQQEDVYYKKYPEEKEQRYYLMSKSLENINRMRKVKNVSN